MPDSLHIIQILSSRCRELDLGEVFPDEYVNVPAAAEFSQYRQNMLRTCWRKTITGRWLLAQACPRGITQSDVKVLGYHMHHRVARTEDTIHRI